MQVILCSLMALGLASVWEYFGHRFILHASPKQAKHWGAYGGMGSALREARFNHLIHHKVVGSCTWTRKRMKASGRLGPQTISQLEQTGFGEFVNPTVGAFALFSAVPLAVIVPMYLIQAPRQLPMGLLIGFSPYIATSLIHPYLHAEIGQSSNFPVSTCGRTLMILLKPLRRYHAVHHACPWRNFNLVPGGDQLISSILLIISLLSQVLVTCRRLLPSQQSPSGD